MHNLFRHARGVESAPRRRVPRFALENAPPMRYNAIMRAIGNQGNERRTLLFILAAGALLRFFRLGNQSLWVDETMSFKAFTSVAGVPYWKKFLYDVHGPLYSLIMHFWSAVSRSDAWLRAPSAIAGACAVYVLYRWLIELRVKNVATAAALFMALSPFHLYYSQELRFYSMLSLFVCLTLIAFERFRAAPSFRTGAMLGLSFALTSLTHFSGLFLGAALFTYLLITGRLRGAPLRFGAVAAVIVLVVISPWVFREISFLRGIRVVDITTLPVEERLRGELTLSYWSYPYTLYAFATGYSFGPSLAELHLVTSPFGLFSKYAAEFVTAGLLFGGLFISGIIRSSRYGQRSLFLTVIIVVLGSVTIITAFNVKVFNVRYLMCVFPFFIALIAFGLPAARAARFILIGAVCAVMLVSDLSYFFNPRCARENVRDAVKIIAKHESRGDLMLVPNVAQTFEHYYRGENAVQIIYPVELGKQRIDELIHSYFEVHPRIWYLRSRYWDKDPGDILLKSLPEQGRLAGSWELQGVLLNLYEK